MNAEKDEGGYRIGLAGEFDSPVQTNTTEDRGVIPIRELGSAGDYGSRNGRNGYATTATKAGEGRVLCSLSALSE